MRQWSLLCAVVIVLAGCSSSGRTITIHGHNMQNTLQPGQHLHLRTATAGYAPAVRDIVEFKMPADWDSAQPDAISRIIATGGQTIRGSANKVQVSTDNGQTYRTLDEPYVLLDGPDFNGPDFGPVTVPPGRLWLMGDHRNESADSRYHCSSPGTPPDPAVACDPMTSTVPVSSVEAYRRG
jgi:signal peptidase I